MLSNSRLCALIRTANVFYILHNNDGSDDNPIVWARSVVEGRHRGKQEEERM